MGQGLGFLDEVGGFADEALDGVCGLAETGVEAIAVEDVPSFCVARLEAAHFGVVLGEP